MLSKVESKIMDYLFLRGRGKKTVLLTPKEILQSILPKYELTAKQLESAMKNIALDGYIEMNHSDNKGSLVYVVTLKQRGEAYQREKDEIKARRIRSVGWKVLLTIGGVVLAWIINRVFFT